MEPGAAGSAAGSAAGGAAAPLALSSRKSSLTAVAQGLLDKLIAGLNHNGRCAAIAKSGIFVAMLAELGSAAISSARAAELMRNIAQRTLVQVAEPALSAAEEAELSTEGSVSVLDKNLWGRVAYGPSARTVQPLLELAGSILRFFRRSNGGDASDQCVQGEFRHDERRP